MSVLLLDVSYAPVRVVSVRRAVMLLLDGKADLIEVDPDGMPIRSQNLSLPRPAVIRLLAAGRAPFKRLPVSRRVLTHRDQGVCQVEGCKRAGRTIDHVVPRSRGGKHVWTNVTLMCAQHNHKKADRTLAELGWSLKREPFEPRRMLMLVGQEAPASWSSWIPSVG